MFNFICLCGCRAEAVYQSMKSVYGTHACHMLQINSVNHTGANPLPNLPDPWSQFIIPTGEDTLVSNLQIQQNKQALIYSVWLTTWRKFGGHTE